MLDVMREEYLFFTSYEIVKLCGSDIFNTRLLID